MKLYTEEQVIKIIERTKAYKSYSNNQLIETLTPIELPSDEEIKEAAPYVPQDSHDYYYGEREGFKDGAKWMKEQILNQNK